MHPGALRQALSCPPPQPPLPFVHPFQANWTISRTAPAMGTSASSLAAVCVMWVGQAPTARSPTARWAAQTRVPVWMAASSAGAPAWSQSPSSSSAARQIAVAMGCAWTASVCARNPTQVTTVASCAALGTALGRGNVPTAPVCAKKATWVMTAASGCATTPAVAATTAQTAPCSQTALQVGMGGGMGGSSCQPIQWGMRDGQSR